MDSPPLGDLFGGPNASQSLAPAVLPIDPSRMGMPAPSGPMVASTTLPNQGVPYSTSIHSSQLNAPEDAHLQTSSTAPRVPMPAPQALKGAPLQQSKLNEPNADGPTPNPQFEPSIPLDPIAAGSKGAPLPAPAALPARAPAVRQQDAQRAIPANFSVPLRLPNSATTPAPGPHVFPQEAQSALNNGRKTYASHRQTISPSERSLRKSFASVLQSAPDSACHQFVAKEPFLHRGEPALTITADEEASLTEPFKFTLVGKFSHRKPSMVEVRNSFQKFRFTGEFKIGLIDFKHILIHLTHEDDYSRLFLKPLWFIMGCPMRVLKWTCDFHPDAETPIAPVWISFPLLPVDLRAKEFLFALSKLVGVPLRIDEATADLLRPSEVRVCVEVNLEHKLPDRVWIERGESRSFWQPVVYEQLPHFCAKCRHMGHLIDKCRAGMPPLDVEKVVQATKPVGAPASKPVIVPKPTVDPAPKLVVVELPVADEIPLVDRIGKGKGKEVVVEPRK
ncbi:Uncharacterized protein Adt_25748 [Abeliophyllum distichum]|uniref:DUF4283 domain-containing protein n=1 Tax=Abeliophyllum distichum TaxID=126358 RepID=A0ABD1SKD4_9LAMI